MATGLEAVRQARNFLDALQRDDNYGWDPERGFVVRVPDNTPEQYHPRYSSGHIARELARVKSGDHTGDTFVFWLSQALHYGIDASLDPGRLQRDFEHKLSLDSGRLTVPMRLLALSQRIQDRVQSASLETEIKQEDEETSQIPAEKYHEQAMGKSESEPRRRREAFVQPTHLAGQDPSARGNDGGEKRVNSQSLDLTANSTKSLPQTSSRARKQTCQGHTLVHHSGAKATTATTALTHRARITQPRRPNYEVVIPPQFSDADSYLTPTPSPIPPAVSQHSKGPHDKPRGRKSTSHAPEQTQPDGAATQSNLRMGAGLSHETSNDDENSLSQSVRHISVTQQETNAPQEGKGDPAARQKASSHLANTDNGKTQASRTVSANATGNSQSRPQKSKSSGVRGPTRSKTTLRKDSRSHSVFDSDAPVDENDEDQQLEEALKLSANLAPVNVQATAETDSHKGRTWEEYMQQQPQQLQSIISYPPGWKPDLVKYPHMSYILQEIRSRLDGGLYSDTTIQFCIELADGDPELSYRNYVEAAGIEEVDLRPMSAYTRWIPGYKHLETHSRTGSIPSTNGPLGFGASHTKTATPQTFPTSQASTTDEMDLSGQTLVPSRQATEQLLGSMDNIIAHHHANVALPRPNLTAMANRPRPWRSQDEMDIGVLYLAENRDLGYYVRTHEATVQNKFPVNALASAWKKIEEEEKLMQGLGMHVPSRVGYDHQAQRGKDLRQYVLGPVQRMPTVVPHRLPGGNVSHEGHTSIPWQIQAMKDASNEPDSTPKPTDQTTGPARIERDEVSGLQSPESHEQVDETTQPTTTTILAQDRSKGKRKRILIERSGMNEHDSSMTAFRHSVKKRKSACDTEVQQSSTPSDAKLGVSPAAETSSILQSAHSSRATATGSNNNSTANDAPARHGPTASRVSVLATAADNTNIGPVTSSPGDPESPESTEWECEWDGCTGKYGTVKALYDHVRIVHVGYKLNGNLNLRCRWGECPSELSTGGSAVRHILQHVPYEPFACDTCGQTYQTRLKLLDHACQPKDIHNNGVEHVELVRSDGHVVAGLDLSGRQVSPEDADQTPVSLFRGNTTQRDHDATHTSARPAANEGDETTQQHDMPAESLRPTKKQFPTQLLASKGNDLDFEELDEEALLARYEKKAKLSDDKPNNGIRRAMKRRDKFRLVMNGIRAGTIESSAEAQLRLGRDQRETLKAKLQAPGTEDVDSVRDALERVATKIKTAKKVVAQESADRRKKRGKSDRRKKRKD